MWRMIVLAVACLVALPARAEEIHLAVTTSFENSGLADALLPMIERDTGVTVRLVVVGTGQALKLGEAGDVDAVLVHSRKAEDAFVAAGHAHYRRDVMVNDFVIVGPETDPAAVRGSANMKAAMRAIASTKAPFISRGDDSGTHRREQDLWALAGVTDLSPDWYREGGAGMGAILNMAAALDAYTLADRGSWLNFQNRRGLVLLFEGDAALDNPYAWLPVSAKRHPHVKAEAAKKVEDWLTGAVGQKAIADYRVGGEALFRPNAQ